MNGEEHVWENGTRGPLGRFPRGPKLLRAVLVCFVIAIAAVSIPLLTTSKKPAAAPSGSSTPTASTAAATPSSSRSQEPQGPPIGVLVYPTTSGYQADSIDNVGVRRPCFRGSKNLAIQQVIGGRVYFTDGELFATSLNCEAPIRLVSRRQLAGKRFKSGSQISCLSLSPDRKRMVFDFELDPSDLAQVWVARSDGSLLRRRSGTSACANPIGWVDNTHYLIQPSSDIQAYALDTATGSVSFLRNAEMWNGGLSPDGTMAVYSTATGGNVDGIFLLDRHTGSKRKLSLGADTSPEAITFFRWSPSSTRFMLDVAGGDPLLFSRTGKRITGASPPVSGPDSSDPGWFDDKHAWIAVGSRIVVYDVVSGAFTFDVTLDNVDTATGVSLYMAADHPGILMREPTLQTGPDPELQIAPGIYARTAPGWRVLGCPGCASGPYRLSVQLAQSSTRGSPCFPGDGFLFGWTGDSVSLVRSRLMHAWGADRPGHSDPTSSNYVAVVQKTLTVGGQQFILLEGSFYECADWVAFGRVGARTLLIDVPFSGLDIPANKVVIDTLRFAS